MIDLTKVIELKFDKVIGKIEDINGITIYEAWRELIKNGVPPLTLFCKGEDLIDYKIYGNSVQDGTPTTTIPIEIESVGIKTKNLFDITLIKSGTYVTNNGDGSLTTTGTSYSFSVGKTLAQLCPSLRVGDVVTLSGETDAINEKYNTTLKQIYLSGVNITWNFGGSQTITQEMLDSKVVLYSSMSNDGTYPSTYWNMQIEYGTKATEYEPYGYIIPVKSNDTITNIYLYEPLRKIGDCADYIDFKNKKVVRNIKYMEFTENDSWSVYASVSNHFQLKVSDNYFSAKENYIVSNYYPPRKNNNSYYTNEDYGVMSVDGGRIRFKNKDLTTIDEWKNWLSSLDEKLYAIYRLATPTEQTIELPNIPTTKGTTILSIETNTQPSNLEVIYKGK